MPILRYLDILIGLAVVMLLLCTVVTAATQLICSTFALRARHLRDGLRDLLTEIDPERLGPHAAYIADRCLRHAMIAGTTWLGGLVWGLAAKAGKKLDAAALPLPARDPADVIQREELILFLLSWACDDSSVAAEDKALTADPAERQRLDQIRAALREALAAGGIGDPKAAAGAIHQKMMENEVAQPDQAAAIVRGRAVAEASPAPFTALVLGWFDNTMARVTSTYQGTTRWFTVLVTLAVCTLIQLDSLALVERLSLDEGLRDSLVQQAQVELDRYEQAQRQLEAPPGPATVAPQQRDEQQEIRDEAERNRETIAATLATLRGPKIDILPDYLVYEKVAQARVCQQRDRLDATLSAGGSRTGITIPEVAPANFLTRLRTEILKSPAPVTVRRSGGCLVLVARSAGDGEITLIDEQGVALQQDQTVAIDWAGLKARAPGVLLSFVLVSLGAPFWYDLLKKLVGFRSLLANKDDDERRLRQAQQAPLPAPAPSQPAAGAGDDERGDLRETGAAG